MAKFKGNIFETTAVKPTVKKPKAAEKKERMTYWLSPDLIDKVQAYAYWTPGGNNIRNGGKSIAAVFQRKKD